MKTVYLVLTDSNFVIGVFASRGDAEAETKIYGDKLQLHITESIYYPESWREGNP